MTNRTLSVSVSGKDRTYSAIKATVLQTATTLQLRRTHIADEEGVEPSTNGLTNRCSAIELFIHCWPGEIRTHNPPVKSRVHLSSWATSQFCCGYWIRTNIWSLWDFWINRYSKPQLSFCWLNKSRTCIAVFVAQYSHPLNYKPSFVRPSDSNWIHPPAIYFSEREGDEYVTLTPGRILVVGWLRGSNPDLPLHRRMLYQLS